MEAAAKLRNGKGSARKVRLVADLIRGKGILEAENIIRKSRKTSSEEMWKLLRSACHNWEGAVLKDSKGKPVKDENNRNIKPNEGMKWEESDLYVKSITVDAAKVLKRWNPAPHGRAHRILKRMHHMTILVDSRIKSEPAKAEMVEAEETAAE